MSLLITSSVSGISAQKCVRAPARVSLGTCASRHVCSSQSIPLPKWSPMRGDLHVARFQNAEASGAPAASKADDDSSAEPTVDEIMTPHPLVLREDMPIQRAVKLLLEHDVSGAPVVDDDGHLVGILSESDLIWKGAGSPQDHFIIPPVLIGIADLLLSWRDNKQVEEDLQKILAKTVGQAMSRSPIYVHPEMTMADAATLMLCKKVNRLPVVEDGKVVGVLTRHDIVRGLVATNSPLL